MRIQGNYAVIENLLKGNDEVVYNLVLFLCNQNGVRLYSDERSYLTAQTNANCPMWVYVNSQADEQTANELFYILSYAMEEKNRLYVNAQEGFAEKVLSSYSEQYGLKLFKRKPLNAYYIKKVRKISPVGKMAVSEEKYEKDIAKLIQQSSVDDCDGDLTDEQAMQFAKTHANSGNLYLWLQEGVVSMARIIRYGTKYARITSVATEKAARGNGYAKMLVGGLSERLLAEGITPVLYARSENSSSNRCYQNIGFEKAGEICEFRLEK